MVTGYTSPAGMAWLAGKAAGRQVSLVVGDLDRSQIKGHGTPADRKKSLDFLRRENVRLHTWKHAQQGWGVDIICHAKLWAVVDGQLLAAALAGSANLTYTGMNMHFEIMAPVADYWLEHLSDQMAWLLTNSEDSKAAVIKMLAPSKPGRSRSPQKRSAAAR